MKMSNFGKDILRLLTVAQCPHCHNKKFLPDEKENTMICFNCKRNFIVENGIIDFLVEKNVFNEEEDQLFEEMKKPRNPFIRDQWRKSKDSFLNIVKNDMSEISGKTILNIGCGIDEFRRHFSARLYISADITKEMLKQIEVHEAEDNKFLVNCSIEKLPFQDNSIDYIFCIDLIHHFYSRGIDLPLREMVRCLKKGGVIYLEEVNRYSFWRLPYSFLPLNLLNKLRRVKSIVSKNHSKPASYEGPLSLFEVKRKLQKQFILIKKISPSFHLYPCYEYPNIPEVLYNIYKIIGHVIPNKWFQKFFSFHWFMAISSNAKTGVSSEN